MKHKPEIIILVGPPGSGKSQYASAHNLYKPDSNYVYINQDSQGQKGHLEAMLNAVSRGQSVIVDRMNFSIKQRKKYIDMGRIYDCPFDVKIVVFQVPYQLC